MRFILICCSDCSFSQKCVCLGFVAVRPVKTLKSLHLAHTPVSSTIVHLCSHSCRHTHRHMHFGPCRALCEHAQRRVDIRHPTTALVLPSPIPGLSTAELNRLNYAISPIPSHPLPHPNSISSPLSSSQSNDFSFFPSLFLSSRPLSERVCMCVWVCVCVCMQTHPPAPLMLGSNWHTEGNGGLKCSNVH